MASTLTSSRGRQVRRAARHTNQVRRTCFMRIDRSPVDCNQLQPCGSETARANRSGWPHS